MTSPTTRSYIEISTLLPPLTTFSCTISDMKLKMWQEIVRNIYRYTKSDQTSKKISLKNDKPPDVYFSSLHLGLETEETAYNHLQLQNKGDMI
jgi:hypothetical protein